MGLSPIAVPTAGWPAQRRAAVVADSRVLRGMLFCAGVLLPLLTLETEAGRGASPFLTDRIAPVDVVTLVTVGALVLSAGVRLTGAAILYLYALTISLCIGVMAGSTGEEVIAIVTAYVAMLMAFLYWMLGYSVGRSPALVRALVVGIMAGVAWESVIVVHDYFLGSPWFMDKLSGRVRGTFKKSGQLGAYGFASAGLLLAIGWAVFDGRRARRLAVVLGMVAVFMVVAASRRSAMIALSVWLLLFLLTGARHARTGSYKLALLGCLGIVTVAAIFAEQLANSFLAQRLTTAFSSVAEGSSFTAMQYTQAMAHVSSWFPFGVGVGRWALITGDHELHNGHLALAVETGVLGLLAFYALASTPLRRDWRSILRGSAPAVPALIATFLLAASVMMVHNRLHRDRALMLFLGLSAGLSSTVVRGGRELPDGGGRLPGVPVGHVPGGETVRDRRAVAGRGGVRPSEARVP